VKRQSIDSQTGPAGHTSDEEVGLYLYGIVNAPDVTSEPFEMTSADGSAIRAMCSGDLAAIVRNVLLDDFSEERLRGRLSDGDALARLVHEHHQVVASIHERYAMLPAKFGSIYASEQDLARALRDGANQLLARLDLVYGCDEWALHLFGTRSAVGERAVESDPELQAMRDEIDAAAPGRGYMLRQRFETRLREVAEREETRLVELVFNAIYPDVAHRLQLDAARQNAPGVDEQPELARASLLVRREKTDDFLERAESIAVSMPEIRIEVSGPWPVYSFAKLELETSDE
jgi:hypothetical protein